MCRSGSSVVKWSFLPEPKLGNNKMQKIARSVWNVLDFYAPIHCDSTSLWGTSDVWGSHPTRLTVPSPVSSRPSSTHLSGELICVRRMERSECGGGWLRVGNFSPSCFHFQSQCGLSAVSVFSLCSENFEQAYALHGLSRLKHPKTQWNRQLMSLCESVGLACFTAATRLDLMLKAHNLNQTIWRGLWS